MILEKVETPEDLRKLNNKELLQLASELREFIIDQVSGNPGHLGANLGVVELSIALHYVYGTPNDKLIWDVGHQAYAHKILTGRKDRFHTNRKLNGISGFPKMDESEYDAFGVGHSSTSISAALGIAVAAELHKDPEKQVIAIIGDGSLTGGLAFEGLNNAGIRNTNLLVILNDNRMAIDANVGALSQYLIDISTSKTYNKAKTKLWNLLGKYGPVARNYIRKIQKGLKTTLFSGSNLFESLHFRYFGPVDGHDLIYLIHVLKDLKELKGPKILHCLTVKGKGYKHAEENQTLWHAPGQFNKETGEIIKKAGAQKTPPRYQDVFGCTLLELARMNENIVGITPAMPSGCSMNIMMAEMPHRVFDVGIAEQHAVTFSAGLATQGIVPYCNIYSSFMQRAFDSIIHDVALQKLNVILCLDRAGLVGEDGATHHGVYDIAYMRCIPGITIAAPMDEIDLRNLMYTAQLPNKGPFVIRYPRGNGVYPQWQEAFKEISIGKGRMIKSGADIAILSIGHPGNFALEAAKQLEKERINIAVYDMRFVKPLDEELLHEVLKNFPTIITIEDGSIKGGFGSAVLEFMCDNTYTNKVIRLGIPDEFIQHGKVEELHKICQIDTESIVKTVKDLVPKAVFGIHLNSLK